MLNNGIMIDPDLQTSGPSTAPKSKGVADDMAAIFGREQRSDAVALPVLARPDRVRRRRRPWRAVLATGGVVTMLAVGVVAGSTVMEAPDAVPVKAVAARRTTPPPRQAAAPVELAAPAMPVAPVAPVALAATTVQPSVPPVPAGEPAAMPPPVSAAPRARAGVAEDVADALPRPVPRSEPVERLVPVPDRRPALASVATRREACFDEASCLAPQLRAAERGVAVAYDQATQAQVRAGTLRDYRDEWLRARRVAARRPREALRIYGMIAADLRLFAEDTPDERTALR